jgi:hypothetical protein
MGADAVLAPRSAGLRVVQTNKTFASRSDWQPSPPMIDNPS